MADPLADGLAESARNRGLKLVRSRIRTPGKPGYGLVGLTDAADKPVFGIEDGAPVATMQDVAERLRALDAADWSESLGVRGPKRKRPKPPSQSKAAPAPKPPPPPEPVPAIRIANASDANAMAALMGLLDHRVGATGVAERLERLVKLGEAPLVATIGADVVGLCGLHIMEAIHRDSPVGRITILVVSEAARGKGIGRMLLAHAVEVLRDTGCGLIEVTSNDRLAPAHAFYRHFGFERTGMRFALSSGS